MLEFKLSIATLILDTQSSDLLSPTLRKSSEENKMKKKKQMTYFFLHVSNENPDII